MSDGPALGTYLRNRRTKLDPASFGLAGGRRRTPGLRREEVAQRAGISATWYTWLEQVLALDLGRRCSTASPARSA
jgi:transcriptional regulator with XRE-family HTH domain